MELNVLVLVTSPQNEDYLHEAPSTDLSAYILQVSEAEWETLQYAGGAFVGADTYKDAADALDLLEAIVGDPKRSTDIRWLGLEQAVDMSDFPRVDHVIYTGSL